MGLELLDSEVIVSSDDRETLMYREAGEAGAAVRRFLQRNRQAIDDLGDRLRELGPAVVVTCARGSSDNAATYGKYLIETRLGVPVSSFAPSVASVYDARAEDSRAVCIAISQSGGSPDLLAAVRQQKAGGALVAVLVNDEASALAGLADVLLPLHAGPERSVAATKSCIVSLAGLAAITAAWAQDGDLADALVALPDRLDQAFGLDWEPALAGLARAHNLFVIGRGYGYGIAQEAALKLKETCALHAEAFSAAEVRHGPMTIIGPGFPLLAFATSDSAGDSVRAAAQDFAGRDADVYLADASAQASGGLPALAGHPAIEPILMLESFYRFVEALSRRRGLDPDAPPHLAKVTRTL